jgi:hypothetical protein
MLLSTYITNAHKNIILNFAAAITSKFTLKSRVQQLMEQYDVIKERFVV